MSALRLLVARVRPLLLVVVAAAASMPVLAQDINETDGAGNTALHRAMFSFGGIDVAEIVEARE